MQSERCAVSDLPPSTPVDPNIQPNEESPSLIIFGDVSLSVIAVAAAIVSMVGALSLFGALLAMCIELPIALNISLMLVGAAVSMAALFFRHRYIPHQEEEDDSLDLSMGN